MRVIVAVPADSISASTAAPISCVERAFSPGSARSAVRSPLASTRSTAASSAAAAASCASEKRSSRAADRIAASGFAMPLPAMSGALPWIGS